MDMVCFKQLIVVHDRPSAVVSPAVTFHRIALSMVETVPSCSAPTPPTHHASAAASRHSPRLSADYIRCSEVGAPRHKCRAVGLRNISWAQRPCDTVRERRRDAVWVSQFSSSAVLQPSPCSVHSGLPHQAIYQLFTTASVGSSGRRGHNVLDFHLIYRGGLCRACQSPSTCRTPSVLKLLFCTGEDVGGAG